MDINLRSNNYKHLYDDLYFQDRNFVDKKRLKSFCQEKGFIHKYVKGGLICDVGCGTGEFLSYIEWHGDKYGMEINESAKKMAINSGISFEKDILNQTDFFDVVIFRGTIQHLPNPFSYIQNAYNSLKTGGYIIFLATPNSESIYYKLWGTMPSLGAAFNFWIPGSAEIINVMNNFGFNHVENRYPYIDSPYSSITKDHILFIIKLISGGNKKIEFPFWKNVSEHIFMKP